MRPRGGYVRILGLYREPCGSWFMVLTGVAFLCLSVAALKPSAARADDGISELDAAVQELYTQPAAGSSADTVYRNAESIFRRGIESERLGETQAALLLYNSALRLRFVDARFHFAAGRLLEPNDPEAALFHYQCAFRFSTEKAAARTPAVEMLRRHIVNRYLHLAGQETNPWSSSRYLELAGAFAPDDPRIHSALGSVYFVLGIYDRTAAEFQSALSLGLEGGVVHVDLAAALAQMGMRGDVEAQLSLALNHDDFDNASVLNMIRNLDLTDSLVSFRRMLGNSRLDQLLNNSAKQLLETAILCWNRGDTLSALRAVQRAADLHPSHSYSMIALGDYKLALGDTPGARAAYLAAQARFPQNDLAMPRLGNIYMSENNYASAADCYMKAAALINGREGEAVVIDQAAMAMGLLRHYDSAVCLLDRWLAANPDAPETLDLLVRKAGILLDSSRDQDAQLLLRALVDRYPTNPAAYIALQAFHVNCGENDRARAILDEGIARIRGEKMSNPLNPVFYRDLARLYWRSRNDTSARQVLLEGGIRTPEKRYFANALFSVGAETEAYEVLKFWIATEPSNAEAILSWGWVAARLGRDLPEAFARVTEAMLVDLHGDSLPAQRTRAYILFSMMRYGEAINEMKSILVSDDVEHAAFLHRLWGLAAEELNRRTESLEHLRRAYSLDPAGNVDLAGRISDR